MDKREGEEERHSRRDRNHVQGPLPPEISEGANEKEKGGGDVMQVGDEEERVDRDGGYEEEGTLDAEGGFRIGQRRPGLASHASQLLIPD